MIENWLFENYELIINHNSILFFQAAVNAFMHQAQASSTTSASDVNCGLDVKPTIPNGGGQSAPKQREGTNNNNLVNSNNSNNNNNNSSNSSSANNNNQNQSSQNSGQTNLNGGLFEVPQNPYNGGYEANGGYNYHQGNNAFQTGSAKMAMNSPHSKPQRTKARTSAGKKDF